MDSPIQIDFGEVARQLGLPPENVGRTVELLDDGNTVPFITRYRRDQTGGLDEQQIRDIQGRIDKLRVLEERKESILRAIRARDALTDELETRIRAVHSSKLLEDLYLPYKIKKQTRAMQARERGLEPLANKLLEGGEGSPSIEELASEFIDAEKQLQSAKDVVDGVRDIIAERFSENIDLRQKLREIIRRSGSLVSKRSEISADDEDQAGKPDILPENADSVSHTDTSSIGSAASGKPEDRENVTHAAAGESSSTSDSAEAPSEPGDRCDGETVAPTTDLPDAGNSETEDRPPAIDHSPSENDPPSTVADTSTATPKPTPENVSDERDESAEQDARADQSVPDSQSDAQSPDEDSRPDQSVPDSPSVGQSAEKKDKAIAKAVAGSSRRMARVSVAELRRKQRREARHRKRKKLEASFSDYFDFRESVSKMPPHRVLAINRGERFRILRAKLDVDDEAVRAAAETLLVPEDHVYVDFLRDCVRESLCRLVLPSLERELRRDLTERAEAHAVDVFSRNLRKLLLQPPVQRRVLAIDPGYRSGCKTVALDEYGNVLENGLIHVIGEDTRKTESQQRLVGMIRRHNVSVVAIGNGTACRETEQFVAELMQSELANEDVAYVIVNEAGASVYSTSVLAGEELPQFDATVRGAISIGRRLLDPLSELVKIEPGNIGVGMYQHDVKTKPLQESLDSVVRSCVNYVGVDANTASPALLRYVSGLNQLTARRLYEYRCQHGPFSSRDQFKQVPGIGDATFVQAAGFLKVNNGDSPLDATWIHPESYEAAERLLTRLGASLSELAEHLKQNEPVAAEPPAAAETDVATPSETDTTSTDATAPPTTDTASTDATTPPTTDTASTDATTPPTTDTASTDAATPPTTDTTSTDATTPPTTDTAPTDATAPPTTDTASTDAARAVMEPSSTLPPDSLTEITEATTSHDDANETVAPNTAGDVDVATEAQPPVGMGADATASEPEPQADAASPTSDDASPVVRSWNLLSRIQQVNLDDMAADLGLGKLLVRDIAAALSRPGRDPRDDLAPPVFRRGIMKLDDLRPGMELSGTVLNVVDFGVFVDVGLSESGLVHISRLASHFVRDPHDLVSVGDVLRVWVVEVDKQRRRVALTAIEPGTERTEQPQRKEKTAPSEPRRSPGDRGRRGGRGREPRTTRRPPPKPRQRRRRPVAPITDAMKDGREPMRTFSDLKQFFDVTESEEKKPDSDAQDGATDDNATES